MKLPFKTKIFYGVGGVSDNALFTLTGTYLLLFLTTVAGVNPSVAGTIAALGSIWEAICGPIIGSNSDRTSSRYGKRKPFIMTAAIPLAIITSLLFMTIDASPTVKAIYYGAMIVLFWTFFSMEFIPYLSWGSDLTTDYNERTVLRSYAYFFNQVGMLIGMVLPTIIVSYLKNLGKTDSEAWHTVGIVTGICACMALLICTLNIHNDDGNGDGDGNGKNCKKSNKMVKEKISPFTIIKEYAKILKIKSIRYLVGASMLYLVANTIFSSDRVFYMKYNLGMDEKTISLMMFIITFSGILFVPITAKLSAKFDKNKVFMFGIGVMGALMIVSRFVGINGFVPCIALCVIYSLANTCYWQLMPSMMYDVCEVEELMSGKRHAGTVISLQALSESISIAVGLQTLGIILDLSGFVETNVVQTSTALTWVSNSFTLLPGIFMVLVLIVMIKYPINKKIFAKVLKALESQKAGQESEDEIREIKKVL